MAEATAATDVAAIIGALSAYVWPLVVAFTILILRKPLVGLIGRIRSGNVGRSGISFETFEVAVREVAAKTGIALGDDTESDVPEVLARVSLSRLAVTAPRTAVMQAWPQVRNSVKILSRQAVYSPTVVHGTLRRLALLVDRGVVDASTKDAVQTLRTLYYRVRQQESLEVTPGAAAAYVVAVQVLIDELDSMSSQRGGAPGVDWSTPTPTPTPTPMPFPPPPGGGEATHPIRDIDDTEPWE